MAPENNYLGVTVLWLFAIGGMIAAVPAGEKRTRQNISGRLRWLVYLGMALIVLVGIAVRFWQLDIIPFNVGGDEGSQGLDIVKVLDGTLRNPFTTGWLSVPTMGAFVNSIWLIIFGQTIWGLRIPWAITGVVTIVATYMMVTRLKGPRFGLVVAALLAVYHFHIHYSRLGSIQISDALFITLTFYFLVRGYQDRSYRDWGLVGIVSAVGMYFYAGARLTPILVGAVVIYLAMYGGRTARERMKSGPLVALLLFLVTAGPILQFANRFPDEFNARINQVGIYQSGWLEREIEILGVTQAEILLDQFQRAFLAFNFYPDRTTWYGLREPLLDPVSGGIFLFALLLATLRVLVPPGDKTLAPMVAWWWAGTLLGGVLTVTPPASMRLVSLAVPVMFLLAYGVMVILRVARRALPALPVNAILIGVVAIFGYQSLHMYFVEFSPQRIYGSHRAEQATELAYYILERGDKPDVYFVGAPWMYWGFATLPYMLPGVVGRDIIDPLTELIEPNFLVFQRPSIFVFLPERIDELGYVQMTYPNGITTEIRSPVNDLVLLTLYELWPR